MNASFKPSPPVLPDLLRPALRIVFCGTAAGTLSAQRGHYYAHPQNKFWPTLHAVGLTPRRLDPSEFGLLPDWGVGLTDIAKTVSGMDKELPRGSLGREACAGLHANILKHQPAILAFTSLTAGGSYLRRQAAFIGAEYPFGPRPSRSQLSAHSLAMAGETPAVRGRVPHAEITHRRDR